MAKDRKLLDKAIHNKELCLFLHNEPHKYNDWVITSAFYSALHFVKYSIFPITMKEVRKEAFMDFKEYTIYKYEHDSDTHSPHEMLKTLVRNQLPAMSSKYRYLFYQSMRSRYDCVDFNLKECDKAIKYLRFIEENCTRN